MIKLKKEINFQIKKKKLPKAHTNCLSGAVENTLFFYTLTNTVCYIKRFICDEEDGYVEPIFCAIGRGHPGWSNGTLFYTSHYHLEPITIKAALQKLDKAYHKTVLSKLEHPSLCKPAAKAKLESPATICKSILTPTPPRRPQSHSYVPTVEFLYQR